MKHILLLALVMVVFSGCVSNKAFLEQQDKLQSIEKALKQNEEELAVLHGEVMQSQEGVELQLVQDKEDLRAIIQEQIELSSSLRQLTQDMDAANEAMVAGISQNEQELVALRDNMMQGRKDQEDEALKAIVEEQIQLSSSFFLLAESMESADKGIVSMIKDLESRLNMISSEGLNPEQIAALAEGATSAAEIKQQVARATGDLADIWSEIDILKQAFANFPAGGSVSTEGFTVDEQSSYEAARDEYFGGYFNKAINQLDKYLSDYPSSQYAGNAVYWKGESYYALSNMPTALREFQLVISRYPKSWKVADAQLKIGMCYMNMGDHASAKTELKKLKKDFPQYSRMDLVDRFLKELK
ncbi:MAG: tol-pal system protein YbgF [Candidatus Cloacimonetes bacterium]|nr:tol-pal system protein YbgF [Candidatus Cloacimonadota bacterium]MCK9184641.1 tol-pal system protein YbgF [Candidatus Cloacimonadota bacterium]